MQDQILPFVIVLFVLSQVSERISNFLKLYLPQRFFGNLDVKEKLKAKEKVRERKIMVISMVAGLITTMLFIVFYNVPEPPGKEQILVDYLYDRWYAAIPLMALFLSFGSKFWHDILDILYLYKNAQRVIRSGEALQASSPEEINQMLARSSVQIARGALSDMKKELMGIKGVVAVGIGTTEDDEPTLRVYFEEGSTAMQLPDETPWEDGTGFVRIIRLEKILSKRIMAQTAKVGGKIALEMHKSGFGTMGFVFQDKFDAKTYFASTCYHVLRPSDHSWDVYSKFPADVVCHLQHIDTCAEKTLLHKGGRTGKLDIALAKLDSWARVDKDSLPRVAKSVLINQDYKNVRVRILTIGGEKIGFIQEWSTTVEIHYADSTSKVFVDFFSIRADRFENGKNMKSATISGDSGSAVVFGDEALGMVVGASDKLTYAMKIRTVEDNFGVNLVPHFDFN
jgi:hypothetical protein